jgi:gas vesicle structural protein
MPHTVCVSILQARGLPIISPARPIVAPDDDDAIEEEQLVLGDLLNQVLDKGVVISGTVTISVADIDLLMLDLRLLLTSIETSMRHGINRTLTQLASPPNGR